MTARLDLATCLIAASAVSCGFDTGGWSQRGSDPDAAGPAATDAAPGGDGALSPDGAAALDAAFACPPGYEIAGESGSAYRSGADLGWLAAEGACEADGPGTHLVVIDDATENATVDAISSASRTWIGYSDLIAANTWRWVTSVPGFDGGWDTGGGQPDGSGDCAVIDQNGGWRDQGCGDSRDYVCECDGRSADPDAF
ncbi:MAG TPA: C-type lectin domain-containing protein [Kofleriaceae bacterium]|jgi:hypothetical protein